MSLAAALVLVVAGQSPALGEAGTWSRSLSPEALATYVDGDAPAVLVVAAGVEAETRAAATDLEAALRKTPKVRLVMSGTSLGDVSSLGDEDIAKKAKGLPIETVAVLRTFPGAEAPTLVVTFYGTEGGLRSALTVVRGSVLVHREGGAGRGVSTAALTAVRADARAKDVNEGPPGPANARWLGPSRGYLVKKSPDGARGLGEASYIDGGAFYSALGRADLASAYNGRRAVRVTGVVTAVIAIPTGAVLLFMAVMHPRCAEYSGTPNNPGTCVRQDMPMALWAGGTLALGVAGAIAAGVVSNHPIDEVAQQALVKAFNERAAGASSSDLQAPPPSPPPPEKSPEVSLRFAVAPTAHGAALVLGGTF